MMSIASEWLESAESLLGSPGEFFRSENRRSPMEYPLKFAAVSITLAAVFNAARSLVFSSPMGGAGMAGSVVSAATSFIGGLIGGLIGVFLLGAFIHIFVYLLGGRNGIGNTISVYQYATVISPITALLAFVPLIGQLASLLVGIYGLFIQVKGLEEFQDLSTGRALIAALIPVVLIVGLVFASMAALFATQSMMQTPTPPPV